MSRPVHKPTPEQEPIAFAPAAKRLLVLAGPGTGKTETVAHRLGYLIQQGLRPAQILVLSFSRNAVGTLSRRMAVVSGDAASATHEDLRHLTVRTFDSWSFRVLRLLNHAPGDLLRNGYQKNVALLIQEMQGKRKPELRDLLGKLRHVIVDELQDLSGVRGALVMELLQLIAPPKTTQCGFTVLGDASQAIYGFALNSDDGEDFKEHTSEWLLTSLRSNYRGELQELGLKENRRASPALGRLVATARKALESKSTHRDAAEKKLADMSEIIKSLPAIDRDGLIAHACNGERTKSLGVLCRTNGEALRLASNLWGKQDEPQKVQIRVAAGSPATSVPAWIGATLGLFRGATVSRPKFDEIYGHLYRDEKSRRNIGVPEPEAAWACLVRTGGTDARGTSFELPTLRERLAWRDFLPDDEDFPKRLVEVLTVHQSKGMEYDEVVMLDSATGPAPEKQDNPEEEANLLFVALSRAGSRIDVCSRKDIYDLSLRTFQDDSRSRWYAWKHGWVNLEMGVFGDLDPVATVSTALRKTAEDAQEHQKWLAANAAKLVGHKVVLVRTLMPGTTNKLVYDVCLQENKEPSRVLGRTNQQLTFDLLSIIHKHGYSLPSRIFNLRISGITTFTARPDDLARAHSPWRESGLWAGVQIHGLGDFKTYSKK